MIRCILKPAVDTTSYLKVLLAAYNNPPTRDIDKYGGAKSQAALVLATLGLTKVTSNKVIVEFRQGQILNALMYGFVIYTKYSDLYKLIRETDLVTFNLSESEGQCIAMVFGSLKQWFIVKHTLDLECVKEVWEFFKGEGFG